MNRIEELQTDARAELDRSLAKTCSNLARKEDAEVVEETVESLLADALARLDRGSDAAHVRAVVSALGMVPSDSESTEVERQAAGTGSVLGMPYDIRIPTGERVARRWWNPMSPKIFVPRAFGMGWDINFGALAVKLNLIEPDAEDEAFASTPDRIFLVALLVPVAFTAAILGSWLAVRADLPAQLPIHWDWRGVPDRMAPALRAWLFVFAMAAVPTLGALWAVALRRPRYARGALVALAGMLSSLAAMVWVVTLLDVLAGVVVPWLLVVGILASLLVPFAMLTLFARAGRAAEIRRDLSRGGL